MKNYKLMLLLIAMSLPLMTIGCATPQNTNTTTAVATPEPTPDKAAITAEITRIENDWPRIIKERDGAAVRRLEADDAVLIYPDGSLGGKEQDVRDIESGNITYDSWTVSEIDVKVLDADAAVATMLLNVKNGKVKGPNGQTQDISGYFRAVDTFARRGGQWQVVVSSAVKLSPAAEQALTAKPTPTSSASPAAKPSPPAKASPTRRPPPPPPANIQ